MGHEVFISYASDGREVAERVCAVLEGRGVACWMAPRDILAGREWAEAVVEAIEQARALVLVLSEGANASAAVAGEVEKAFSRDIPVLLLRIADVRPSRRIELFVRRTQWLDALAAPMEPHLERLADAVSALLGAASPAGERAAASPAPEPRTRRPSRRLVVAAACLGLVAAAALVWFRIACHPSDAGVEALRAGLASAARSMAESIAEGAAPGTKVTVAVLPLLDGSGVGIRRLGVEAARILSDHLAGAPGARSLSSLSLSLDLVPEELKLWMRNVLGSQASAPRGGESLPGKAQFLIGGVTRDSEAKVVLDLKLLEGASGRIVVSTSVEVPRTPGISGLMWYVQRPGATDAAAPITVPPIQLSWAVAGLRHVPGRAAEELVLRDDTVLRGGDMFQVLFTPVSDCYACLILLGSTGRAQLLFPHPEIRAASFCRGGVTQTIPDAQDNARRWYQLDDVPGTETLYLVAAYQPMAELTAVLDELGKAAGTQQAGLRRRLEEEIYAVHTRGLNVPPEGVTVLTRDVAGIAPETYGITLPDDRRIERVGEILRGRFALVKKITFRHE